MLAVPLPLSQWSFFFFSTFFKANALSVLRSIHSVFHMDKLAGMHTQAPGEDERETGEKSLDKLCAIPIVSALI